ncbi:MAG: pitrilysin family protein [Bacillota bacterium]|nr:pitrilysin family protein [Bacillota bacterium]
MLVKEIRSDRVNESYYKINHPSGLTIFVYPKVGYTSSYAILGTKYGSINTEFQIDGNDVITVPDGIAHYLEHKLFESEDGDAFARYAETGASANAYTSFDKTCYLFSTTENFKESFEILLDFVQSPYFTKETVQKEQGIIGQEIRMYDDSPEWRVLFNLLCGMYHNHPVKIDIAGTVESIAEITAEKLYECYNSFYNLHNMALCVVGNVNENEVLEICNKMLKNSESHEINNIFPDEPYEIVKDYVEQSFMVGLPLFQLGFKEKAGEKQSDVSEMAQTDILLAMLASNVSPLYRELMDKNLINSTFGYEVFEGPLYRSIIFSGESRDPKQVADIIKKYIDEVKKSGINSEDFEIAKKAIYGESVASLNSIESIANMILDFHFSGREAFCHIEAIANTSAEMLSERLNSILDTSNCCLSVIMPSAEE